MTEVENRCQTVVRIVSLTVDFDGRTKEIPMRTKPSRDWLEPLRRLPLFRDLNDRDVARVDRLMTPVDVHAGQVLTTEGTTGLQAFIIISGSAEVTIAGRLVAVVGPGEVIGEMALVDHQLRTATVTATEAMRVFVIDPRASPHFSPRQGSLAGSWTPKSPV